MTARDERKEAMKTSLLQWAETFIAGQLADPSLHLEPGERFAVRVEVVTAAGVIVTQKRLDIRHTYAAGDALVTDRRVVVVKDGQPQVEWRWGDDLGDGTLARDGQGVLWLPSQRRHDEGARHLLGIVTSLITRRFRAPDPSATLALVPGWFRVLGAQREARGEIEAWKQEIRSQ